MFKAHKEEEMGAVVGNPSDFEELDTARVIPSDPTERAKLAKRIEDEVQRIGPLLEHEIEAAINKVMALIPKEVAAYLTLNLVAKIAAPHDLICGSSLDTECAKARSRPN